jgi:hypothetical protein
MAKEREQGVAFLQFLRLRMPKRCSFSAEEVSSFRTCVVDEAKAGNNAPCRSAKVEREQVEVL